MPTAQFLYRPPHGNTWYGRVIIPLHLRGYFCDRREIRRSLKTTDKRIAKRRAMEFWLQCQQGFERMERDQRAHAVPAVWNERADEAMKKKDRRTVDVAQRDYIEFQDALGKRHVVDHDDPAMEQEAVLALQDRAQSLIAEYKDQPEILKLLLNAGQPAEAQQPARQFPLPPSPTSFDEAVSLYLDKLRTHGRKGQKLAERTIDGYEGRLEFWKTVFKRRDIHDITLKELADIQIWITRLPSNFARKGLSIGQAVKQAKDQTSKFDPISDKTRADYLGQLKAVLSYAYSAGMISGDIARHIEIPNTKHSRNTDKPPFTDEDMQKIFPENYGVDFGIHKSGLEFEVKYWFPLIAAYTGARLEEIGQLRVGDIITDEDTGIVYFNITDQGAAADGKRKHTKNKNSVRPIPIHSKLIELGLLDYAEKRKQDGHTALFNLKRDNQGRMAKSVTNWFSRMEKRKNGVITLGYIERRGIVSKGVDETGMKWSKSFHTFRHTAIDNLRGKKFENGDFIREEDIALVMGHVGNKPETANYGKDRSQLELRKAVIDRVEYCISKITVNTIRENNDD